MPIEIADLVERLRVGIGLVPPALFAAVLLAGPTAAWLLYRFVVQPRANRIVAADLSAMWVCTNCRSVNELRHDTCYRCDTRFDDEVQLEIVDADPQGPQPLFPVGPGLDLGGRPRRSGQRGTSYAASIPLTLYSTPAVAEEDLEAEQLADVAGAPRQRRTPRRDPRAVGPGRPEVARPRRAVVSGPLHPPDDPNAA